MNFIFLSIKECINEKKKVIFQFDFYINLNLIDKIGKEKKEEVENILFCNFFS